MRDRARIQRILGKLATAWEDDPDSRLGQLISNLGMRPTSQTLFYTEDTLWEQWLDEWIANRRRARQEGERRDDQ